MRWAFLFLCFFSNLYLCSSASASAIATTAPVFKIRRDLENDPRSNTRECLATRSNSNGFKILKSPSASGLHHLCAALQAEEEVQSMEENATDRPETTSVELELRKPVLPAPAPAEHVDIPAASTDAEIAVVSRRNSQVETPELVDSELLDADEVDNEVPGCVPPQVLGSVMQWAEALQRWIQGVPTIFEVDATGCPTLEADEPRKKPSGIRRAASRERVSPSRQDSRWWLRSWWQPAGANAVERSVSASDSAAGRRAEVPSLSDKLLGGDKQAEGACAAADEGEARVAVEKGDGAAAAKCKPKASAESKVEGSGLQLELLSEEDEASGGGHVVYGGVGLRTTGWAGYGVERGAMEPQGGAADRGFTPTMHRSASVVTPITTPRVSHDSLWTPSDQ